MNAEHRKKSEGSSMTGRRLYVITFAMMLSLFLASIEVTVVATAMPTIVAQLGGLDIYAWVFSAYMIASTTTLPIFGKLSDIYGRRRIYLLAVTLFLIGSALCAQAQTMPQLILFRALQGLGAGGIMPLAFTIIGDIFTFEQRAKMQGLFSGVWGISSLIGPLVGGFLVERVSWHWIFYLNVPFGLIGIALMLAAWRDVTPRTGGRVDYAGALLLSGGIVALMFALFESRAGLQSNFVIVGAALLVAFVLFGALTFAERRAVNPILPLALFGERLFIVAISHGFFAGFALFGSTAFIPLFAQGVLGTSATVAGATLTPQMLSWTLASIIGTRMLLRVNYRALALSGMFAFVFGMALMTQVSPATSPWFLGFSMLLSGLGMGLSIPIFLIAVQSTVARQSLGTATATVQFARSIGGAIGTSVMGVILAIQFAVGLVSAGLDPNHVSVNALLDATAGAAATGQAVRGALTSAVQAVFVVALIVAICAWLAVVFAPRVRIGQRAPALAAKESVPAE
jgi:EmrB/QacA subfamily drug resistance transporter